MERLMGQLLRWTAMGPLGIFGPILVLVSCLWLAWAKRAPWPVKVVLAVLLVLVLLTMFGPSLPEGGAS